MARPRVLILGGGFGGLAAAFTLRAEAGEQADLLLVDESPAFMMGLRKLWLLDGRSTRADGTRDRTRLADSRIPFRQGRVDGIDLGGRWVAVDGERTAYDFLIVALGAQPRLDLVSGGVDGALNLYTADGAEALGQRLQSFERGRIVIAIAGLPYKCPPAPYEAAFLIDDLLRRTGRRPSVEIEVVTPQPVSLPVAGPAACARVEGTMAERQIRFRPKSQVQRAEATQVVLADGTVIPGDLVILVPPHRPPAVVKASGLTGDSEWVRADRQTLATAAEGVFAVGDLTEIPISGGQMLPKAGIFAERQGHVVGRNLAEVIAGREPDARFDGRGYCFIEVGEGQASMVDGNFFSDPLDVDVLTPAAEHLAAKVAFERERLLQWFA